MTFAVSPYSDDIDSIGTDPAENLSEVLFFVDMREGVNFNFCVIGSVVDLVALLFEHLS